MLRAISEIFRSVELVWVLWLVGIVAACGMLRLLKRAAPRRSWRQLGRCEEGAAYTLSYVICIPLFTLIVCLVVDMTLILVAKIGTVYAAYASARSAVVWFPSGVSKSTAQKKMENAALHAMTPFASSSTQHRPVSVPPSSGLVYYAAHKSYADLPAPADYIGLKWQYAKWATSVTTDAGTNYKKNVTVTLDYKAPFHMPGIGRLLGTRSLFGFYFTNIRTVVTLENQAPRSDDLNPPSRPLGISYVPATE